MNKRIARLGIVFITAFILLIVNLTYMQFIASAKLTAKPENIRPVLYERRIERGTIISADGKVLATSRKQDDSYTRVYPEGELAAHITGFYSSRYGRAGLELTYDDYLSGQSKVSSPDDYMKRLLGEEEPGNDLTLTLDMNLQSIASKALGLRKGAIVVLDPKTGAVLALVGWPRFDPNTLDDKWKSIAENPEGALLNRATQGRFTPGSSFKIVTAAAAIESGAVTPATVYEAPAQLKIYGGKVSNYGNKGFGRISFEEAFIKSVNTVFAQVGKNLGGQKLVDASEAFGINGEIPFDLPTAKSSVPEASEMDDLEVAWMAVGQGRAAVSPLMMALVGAAVANDGEIMQPYLVVKASERDGTAVFAREPRPWLCPISKNTAAVLKSLMEQVVAKGTGKSAQIPGVRVAGKTGTAEVGKGEPHAWFVGFAPVDNPEVIVAVIVENGGTGGSTAAPIAKQIIAALLGKNH
ncbi:MAG: cell division protein FtsI [Actinobacteria bacterium]|nr:cell division protein FtsI [Actinomycetota bacterium]